MKIIADGDSWFDYPKILGTGGSLIDHISKQLGHPIENLAKAGDETRFMLSMGEREKLEQALKTADILLFSGGGNDIAGDQFILWLQDNKTGDYSDAIDTEHLEAAIAYTMTIYDDLFQLRDAVNPNCTIFTHGYDFPPPRVMGMPVNGLGIVSQLTGFKRYGPWLQPSMEYCGWRNPKDQAAIVREVLVEFNRQMKSRREDNHVHIDTQGACTAKDWDNELHLGRSGMEKIARIFAIPIRRVAIARKLGFLNS